MSDIAAQAMALQELQVRRKFLISAYNKQTNTAAALVRRMLGFDPKLPESEREKIKARATAIAGRVLAGNPQDEKDNFVASAIIADLNVVAKSIEPLKERRAEVEKEMAKLAKQLPVYAWVSGVKGLGPVGLAVIIGETGDLSNYPHWRMVWKRLGLMPYEGKAASSWKSGGLTKENWVTLGYSPKRRAEIHACVADPMSKHQLESAQKSGSEFGAAKGKYGEVYVARREKTLVDHPDWTKAHARADALRIMTKTLISDLWSEWRRQHTYRVNADPTFADAA